MEQIEDLILKVYEPLIFYAILTSYC